MTNDQRFAILTSLMGLILMGFGALAVYVVKGAARWGRTEQRLEDLINSVEKLVENKDATHKEITSVIREDRAATNARLRWLEERLWKGSP